MHKAAHLFGSLLIGGVSALAQASNHAGAPTLLTQPPESRSCPIGFSAQRANGLEVTRVEDGAPFQLGGRLYLNFRQLGSPAIAAIYGLAHGPTLLAGAQYAGSRNHPTDTVEPFHFSRSDSSGSLTRVDLQTHAISSPAWIELFRVDFVDGSHWYASSASQCRATPNGFLLISGAR